MNAFALVSSSIFSGWQISVVTAVCVLIAALIVLNILFAIMWRVKTERKLYNDSLQDRRSALLARLEYLKGGGQSEEYNWTNFALFGDGENDEDEDEAEDNVIQTVVPITDGKQPPNTVVLSVDELSLRVRQKLGMRPKRFNGKKFFVRYSLGFDAKLSLADDDTKERYVEIANTFRSYNGIMFEKNFSVQHFMYGKEVLASMLFVGKRLWVAFALDPNEFTSGKHRGEDKSDKKRFAKTPLVVRVLSDNKLETVKFFFDRLAVKYGLVSKKKKLYSYDLEEKSQDMLIGSGAMRVVIIDEISPLSPLFALPAGTSNFGSNNLPSKNAQGEIDENGTGVSDTEIDIPESSAEAAATDNNKKE